MPDGTVLDVIQQASQCRAVPPDGVTVPGEITPGLVAEAMRRVGLPGGLIDVTPSPTTLVAYPTQVRVSVTPQDTTVTLLGQHVTVHATPIQVIVDFGDGQQATLTPGQTVEHVYTHAGPTQVTAQVVWTGVFHVNDPGAGAGTGGWTPVPGQVPTTSDAIPVIVREAAAQLVSA